MSTQTRGEFWVYACTPPFNSAIISCSREGLEHLVRRSLAGTNFFTSPGSTARVAGEVATEEKHLWRAMATCRRLDLEARGPWALIDARSRSWRSTDTGTRINITQAVCRHLRCTFLSREALRAGATGEWWVETDMPIPDRMIEPSSAVPFFINTRVSGSLSVETVKTQVLTRNGNPYECAVADGLYRVTEIGPDDI